MKVIKNIAWVLLGSLIFMQFFRPEKNESDLVSDMVFITETNPPENVQLALKTSCYDCHSNHTNYPWYFNVAPVSYWIADHIKHGKDHLNFADWKKYENNKKDDKLKEIVETLESGEMPLNEYIWTHAEAQLTEDQREAIIDWAEKTRLLYQLGQRPH